MHNQINFLSSFFTFESTEEKSINSRIVEKSKLIHGGRDGLGRRWSLGWQWSLGWRWSLDWRWSGWAVRWRTGRDGLAAWGGRSAASRTGRDGFKGSGKGRTWFVRWERGALVWESREGSNVRERERERERERDELWNGKRKKIKEKNHYFIMKCNKILLLFLGSCYRAQP